MELNAPLVLFCVLCSVNVGGAEAQLNGSALSPNLLNLAEGRNIWASATCGDGNEKEEYCILGETNVGQDYIAGQVRIATVGYARVGGTKVICSIENATTQISVNLLVDIFLLRTHINGSRHSRRNG